MTKRCFKLSAALAIAAAATVALSPAAQARHRHHGRAMTVHLVGAHLKPGYVGLRGYAGGPPGVPVVGGFDFGLGPVFPFAGWPKSLL